MGHRANLVRVHEGRVSIHFDRWAGLSLGEMLLSHGPDDLAERIARAQTRETLLDDAWCEGAVLLDSDARLLLFHTVHGPLPRSHGLRRACVALLQQDWPGWTIRWAGRDLADIVDHLGADPAGLVDDRTIERPATIETVARRLGVVTSVLGQPVTTGEYRRDAASTPYDKAFTPPNQETVLTVRFADGRLRDFSIGWDHVGDLLNVGPGLVAALADHPGHTLPNELYAEAGAFIDLTADRISAWPPPRRPGLDVADGRWPGFDIRWHDEGLPGHAARSDRDPDSVRLTSHMLVWQGIELLNPWDTKDLQEKLAAIAVGLDADDTRDQHRGAGSFSGDGYRSILTRLAAFGSDP